MGTWTLVFDIIKSGFVLAVIIGIVYLIIWAMKRNIKWLFGLGKADAGLVDWLVAGLRKGYDDNDLKMILLGKDYNLKKISKALKEAFRIIIKEVEEENAKEGRGLGNVEEEIKKLAGKK